ncbi:MAG: Gfo/Idh/MocA family oxidoreductase [Rhodothermales bacterium]|nr:Gfo/Idh/MocA family oxidoreductase [Rhodothermales bacterium]
MSDSERYLSRRSFLKKSSLGAVAGLALGGERIPRAAAAATGDRRTAADMSCALIGYGEWGREIAATMGRVEEANLVTVCDSYDVMLRRARRSLPGIHTTAEYREVLDDPEIDAVLVATPTPLHRQIVEDALSAGKHVYCEAPLAHTIEDARVIAAAAAARPDQIFQAGLLYATEPQYRSVFGFIRSGALGQAAMARGQWHLRDSWRRTSPSADRERALNWRLREEHSIGLPGEVGVQQYDTANWILGSRPAAVSGFGGIMYWKDGRTIPDTVQTVLEYPGGTNMMYDATLVAGFDAMYDLFFGSDSTIILRDSKAWMFKEVDAPMLGWEVYARKDKFYKETGIALLANATQLDSLGQDPAADDPNIDTPLFYALNAFKDNFHFGPYAPAADYSRGYESTVVAIKAHEAVMTGERQELTDEMFTI